MTTPQCQALFGCNDPSSFKVVGKSVKEPVWNMTMR